MANLGEKCGVFAAYTSHEEAARLAYYGLYALQHRGQESSGIVCSDGQKFHKHLGTGLVAQVYSEDDLAKLPGRLAIGHNRYSTSGSAGGTHPQPIIVGGIALAHNGNLPSTKVLEEFFDSKKIKHEGLNDSEMMAKAIAWYVKSGMKLPDAVEAAYPLFTGAYSCVAMDKTTIVAFRDPYGIRPLALGRLSGGYVVASETCAFETIAAAPVREIEPGEMITLTKSGFSSRKLAEGSQKLDIFEFVYFARPDSNLLRRRVNEVRRRFGRQLAEEHKISGDIVVPVPDSGVPAALGFAEASGIMFDHGLIKSRYIHRTFIRPAQKLRKRDVSMKLNPIPEILMGKEVIVIDDSIVRGTTTKNLVAMLQDAGAAKVNVLISSPPVKYPDFYGIDTPKQKDLIASHMSIEEIRQWIGADYPGYLSFDDMIKATGLSEEMFCTACFTGDYPLDIRERKREVSEPVR